MKPSTSLLATFGLASAGAIGVLAAPVQRTQALNIRDDGLHICQSIGWPRSDLCHCELVRRAGDDGSFSGIGPQPALAVENPSAAWQKVTNRRAQATYVRDRQDPVKAEDLKRRKRESNKRYRDKRALAQDPEQGKRLKDHDKQRRLTNLARDLQDPARAAEIEAKKAEIARRRKVRQALDLKNPQKAQELKEKWTIRNRKRAQRLRDDPIAAKNHREMRAIYNRRYADKRAETQSLVNDPAGPSEQQAAPSARAVQDSEAAHLQAPGVIRRQLRRQLAKCAAEPLATDPAGPSEQQAAPPAVQDSEAAHLQAPGVIRQRAKSAAEPLATDPAGPSAHQAAPPAVQPHSDLHLSKHTGPPTQQHEATVHPTESDVDRGSIWPVDTPQTATHGQQHATTAHLTEANIDSRRLWLVDDPHLW